MFVRIGDFEPAPIADAMKALEAALRKSGTYGLFRHGQAIAIGHMRIV